MSNRIIIKNGKLIFPDEIKENLTLVCENGKIIRISHPDEVVAESGDRVIDAQNRYVSSGFIDIHTHGGGGHDFMDGTVEAYLGAAETHAKHG
ncbi:MAG: N-acetylglucosamine-6-phosphate deacetylase, partial [Proteiniphilum sp.]